MHFQKLIKSLMLAGLIATFSQTALPGRTPAAENNKVLDAKRLETEAQSADKKAAEARQNLEKFERSGDKSKPKEFSHKQLEFKAEVARAEFYAAQARLEALKSRASSAQDAAEKDSKMVTGSRRNKKTESRKQDKNVEIEIGKASEEAFRKGKVAIDATKKAQDAYNELRVSQAREAELQTKLTREDSKKTRLREEANLSPALRNALAIQAEAEKARATTEAAALAKEKELAAAKKANAEAEADAARKAKADREARQNLQPVTNPANEVVQSAQSEVPQDVSQTDQEKELALKVAAAKEILRQAIAEQKAVRTTQGVEEKETSEEQALQKIVAEVEVAAAPKPKSKKSPPKKTVRKVLYSGQLFTLVRDDPVEEPPAEDPPQ